jgi:hypothetical protein
MPYRLRMDIDALSPSPDVRANRPSCQFPQERETKSSSVDACSGVNPLDTHRPVDCSTTRNVYLLERRVEDGGEARIDDDMLFHWRDLRFACVPIWGAHLLMGRCRTSNVGAEFP